MRHKNDFYPTPAWAVDELMKRYPFQIGTPILEPCSGDGAISNRLKEFGHTVYTNDIDPDMPSDTHYDYLTETDINANWNHQYIISNPPFSVAFEFLKKARKESRVVAFLLRLSFLEPTYDRGEYLSVCSPARLIVLPRISFTGNGKTDSVTTAWMIWESAAPRQYIEIVSKGNKE